MLICGFCLVFIAMPMLVTRMLNWIFRGITGFTVFAFKFGTLLLARSFVQDQVSTSFCEAEYYAYSAAVKDIEYVRLLLRDLLLFPDDTPAPTMLVDSELAIAMSQGPTHRSRTKHIDFTLALCRDYVMSGRVRLEHCPTFAQIADMFTKQLGPFFCCIGLVL
jgi:hypothetical protein